MARARKLALVLLACFIPARTNAQKGTAPNGYYPITYNGNIFTGTLESVDKEKQDITIAYVHGDKTEKFTGRFENRCSWSSKDGIEHSFGVEDIPKGTVLTVFYKIRTEKMATEKVNENSIFAVSYKTLHGNQIPPNKRLIVFCAKPQATHFRVF
jgi:hypothetical protein